MDVQPSSINLYRYYFPDLASGKNNAQRASVSTPQSETLFAEVLVSRPAAHYIPTAPQGIGESKHAATRKAVPVEPELNTDTVEEIHEKDDSWLPDSAFKYNAASNFYKPTLGIRQQMENEVRKAKKAGLPCPHADSNFHCSALFIRCGDRVQYANPESLEQRNMPHACQYRAKKSGKYILIVDDNKAVRDFCKNSIELFFNYDGDHIVTAATGNEALQVLNKFKIEGKQCGLLICDTYLPGISGFDIVNEVFERNYNTDVMFTKEQNEEFHEPQGFLGLTEIVPKKTVVKKIISKPFHSSTFIEALKTMDINHLFE